MFSRISATICALLVIGAAILAQVSDHYGLKAVVNKFDIGVGPTDGALGYGSYTGPSQKGAQAENAIE